MKHILIASLAATLMLSACTSDPFTGENQVARTVLGAGGGAAVGAGAGFLLGKNTSLDSRKAALIGAGLGALAGGGIGAYMDHQETILRRKLQRTGVSVTRVGDSIVLNMPSHVTFDSDRDDIKPQFYDTLDSVIEVFKEYNKTLIDVVGHTDSAGDDDYNFDLSRRRAAAVAQYMSGQRLNASRFSVDGRGEREPIASNATSSGKAKNRRVEITIQPLT
jgi:outer membrane protein OmpA-like peptidoglycan-associated protein